MPNKVLWADQYAEASLHKKRAFLKKIRNTNFIPQREQNTRAHEHYRHIQKGENLGKENS